VKYIVQLSEEIQAMEGGDLDHPITVQGSDELTTLASSLDSMRLTLRQQHEDEAAAAAKVKNLITEMSHDLRTPLTTLLLYTEILRHRKYETTAQAEDYLTKIDTKARQLKQLSDNLFEYALVTRDTVAVLDPPARFSQIFEEPLTEMVGELQERGFACALELGEEDDTLTVKEQYVRRILDNITSNLLKYADPAQDISVRFVKENGKAGLAFENAVLPGQHRTDSTKVGLTSIETMMEKMHAACRIEQSGERFCITLLFPIEK
jgi:signal transduction histidine kinase